MPKLTLLTATFDMSNTLSVLTANISAHVVAFTTLASPLLAIAVSVVSLMWIYYKFKNEKQKFDNHDNSKSNKKD
tara:strand:+ start:205 stop:429 length:225 start_codon:yes stop_codon:yes gene_type:complete